MRIISGTHARRSLIPPKGDVTRPITDRVKESLFAILQPRLEGVCVVDLFCGTGSLGLEALSRGARHALMVDRDRDSLKILNDNIKNLDFQKQTTVVKANIFATGIPEPAEPIRCDEEKKNGSADIVFVDPPYKESTDAAQESRFGQLLTLIGEQVAVGALIVARHDRRTQLEPQYGRLVNQQVRRYGSMSITFLEKH